MAVQSGALSPPLKTKASRQTVVGKRKPSGYLYILPAVVLLGLFIVYPFIRAGQYSFLSWDGVGPAHYVGGFNWEQIYLDPVERGSLVNAATLFIFFSLVPVALGLAVVSLLARTRRRGMGVFRVIFFLPQVLVTVVIAVVWTWILAPGGTGSLNGIIHSLGLGPAIGPAWLGDFSTALLAIGLVGTWTEFGLCFVLFLAGIQRIPTEMFDSARIDGAGLIREFRSVIVPMLRREIGAAITISVVASSAELSPHLPGHKWRPWDSDDHARPARLQGCLPARRRRGCECARHRPGLGHLHLDLRGPRPAREEGGMTSAVHGATSLGEHGAVPALSREGRR